MSITERYFTLSVVYLIVECTWRQRKGNWKKNIQIVVVARRLGWKWIERSVTQLLPEWPHSQGGCLACTFESRWCCTDLYYARGAQGVLPMRVGGATSELDLPSLTPSSVAGCGWLQLGVPHWAASAHYCKLLIIEPTFCGSRFSSGRRLAIEDFTFTTSVNEKK